MSRRRVDRESPDRLYTITGGRGRVPEDAFDALTLIVAECEATPGLQSEHARILRLCRRPIPVAELASRLGLPVSVVKILLCDLLDTGRITARHPQTITGAGPQAEPAEGRAARPFRAGSPAGGESGKNAAEQPRGQPVQQAQGRPVGSRSQPRDDRPQDDRLRNDRLQDDQLQDDRLQDDQLHNGRPHTDQARQDQPQNQPEPQKDTLKKVLIALRNL